MREFFFGHGDALDLIGWHIAVLLALLAGWSLRGFLSKRRL